MTDLLYKELTFAMTGNAPGLHLALLLDFGTGSLEHRRIIK
jgi:hypothetical protein